MTASSPPQSRIPSLDGIRAICILQVVGAHASFAANAGNAALYIFNGDLGVQAFFVLSGFLIGRLLFEEKSSTGTVSIGRFYFRRALRLMPVQLAFIGVIALLDLATVYQQPLCNYVTAITYTKNYACGSWVDAHLWSLSVEEQFYLIFAPLVAALSHRHTVRVAVAVVLLAPIARSLAYHFAPAAGPSLWISSRMDLLAIGVLLASVLQAAPDALRSLLRFNPALMRAIAFATLYAVWLLGLTLRFGKLILPFGQTLSGLAIAYLIASYSFIPSGFTYRALNAKPVVFIGLISYSLYIWQQPFVAPQGTFGPGLDFFLAFPWNVICAVLVATTSYFLIERPITTLRNRTQQSAATFQPPPLAVLAEPPAP